MLNANEAQELQAAIERAEHALEILRQVSNGIKSKSVLNTASRHLETAVQFVAQVKA